MEQEKVLLTETYCMLKKIEAFYLRKVLPKVFRKRVRDTSFFRRWWYDPMNYARIIELPLTVSMMELEEGQKILDISSPKLLSLYLGTNGFPDITVSDLVDDFSEDFVVFSGEFHFSPGIEIFDATEMPLKDNTFDRIFSVSVLEHIPEDGDIGVICESERVLKKGGVFVITLPAGIEYSEEWLSERDFSWPGTSRGDGKVLFQKRYDKASIMKRFSGCGLEIEDIVFIAEKPIRPPEYSDNGRLLFNYYYLEDLPLIRLLRKITRLLKIPLLLYAARRSYALSMQYLTREGTDENIREVAVKLRKK
ncbi:MAG: class I SAM-dependent methyltransferase [Candidatus Tantalella remota]|nr:class I SAM-dependent methyltransferase [Candidatus Tantalella remota]